MDKLCEFHLHSGSRGAITFHLDNGKSLVIPVQKSHSNKLSTSFVAPEREVNILKDMIPEDVSVVLHEDGLSCLLNDKNHVEAFSDRVTAVNCLSNNKTVTIIVLDAFCLERHLMNQVEREIRELRILFASHNIATTLHHAYPINSANHQAYSSEVFTLFEEHPFPISVDEVNKFNLVLNLENVKDKYSTEEYFFGSLLDRVRDLKK